MNCDKPDDIILFKPITFVATITGCKTKERWEIKRALECINGWTF